MKLRNKKTGEIGVSRLTVYAEENEYVYESLEGLYEEWEDNVPKEPLIKDEKIRETVRAWAEANNVTIIIIFDWANTHGKIKKGEIEFAENGGRISIAFKTDELFNTDKIYTIAELCGEDD